jgi:hypothetical protein
MGMPVEDAARPVVGHPKVGSRLLDETGGSFALVNWNGVQHISDVFSA